MKRTLSLMASLVLAVACNQNSQPPSEDIIKASEKVKVVLEEPADTLSLEKQAEALRQQGHQVFLHEFDGEKYLMQEYYMVFLKEGENREQDSLETAQLMEQHLAHLTRMAEEGYSSLTGPFGGEGDIRGIVVYHTSTIEKADSLANLDPMVQAGRLKVEVYPWWTEKGGQLR